MADTRGRSISLIIDELAVAAVEQGLTGDAAAEMVRQAVWEQKASEWDKSEDQQ